MCKDKAETASGFAFIIRDFFYFTRILSKTSSKMRKTAVLLDYFLPARYNKVSILFYNTKKKPQIKPRVRARTLS